MKSYFNPTIERVANTLFNVDQYADVFEKIAFRPSSSGFARRIFRRRIAHDVQAARLLFIHIPKNGGTSIKRALYASDPGHVTIRYYETFAPDLLRSSTTFAVLRDPVERFLSAYDFLRNGGGGDVRIQAPALGRLGHVRSVDDLLAYLERISGDWFRVDTFVRPQWWYITDSAGTIRARHIWLLDGQRDALSHFLKSHGAAELRHANRTARSAMSLSVTQRQRLEILYRPDFALYELVKSAGGQSTALEGMRLSNCADACARAISTAASISS